MKKKNLGTAMAMLALVFPMSAFASDGFEDGFQGLSWLYLYRI